MELIYLWINNANNCIIKQEFNFSPMYHLSVDNVKNPQKLKFTAKKESVNIMKNGKISNITAVIGSNGAGKTTLLKYLANNNCFNKFNHGEECKEIDSSRYNYQKSIYVFVEENELIVYYNLEHELDCTELTLDNKNVYRKTMDDKIPNLSALRNQMIIYLTNSSYVPNSLSSYSCFDNTYNISLHMKTLYLIANRFYNLLWDINTDKLDMFDRAAINTLGFAGIVQINRDEKTFQELLDVMYYQFLSNNCNNNCIGNFKDNVYVYFENIIDLCKKIYDDDIEMAKDIDCNSEVEIKDSNSREYYEKVKAFRNKYGKVVKNKARKNATEVLYFNLIFEAFYYEDEFELPDIDYENNTFEQLKNVFQKNGKYMGYLEDIKSIDDVLAEYSTQESIIEDSGFLFYKDIDKKNPKFYNFIEQAFNGHKAYFFRYIRISNLKMSSGERAMQNLFSWLVLIPQLDQIMSIKRASYTSKLLLIDEIDLYSHPEWQRNTIKQLIDTINEVEDMPIQIILTSHSPIILSDFPHNNIVYLFRDIKNKTTSSINSQEHKKTFGANIYTLFDNAFFMEQGIMGEFARNKILEIYNKLREEPLNKNDKEKFQYFINLIGDPILKKEMQKLFNQKNGEKYTYD